MTPYQQVFEELNLLGLTDQQEIPQLNGCLLCTPAGSVFLVVNGVARGFDSWSKLMRICSEYPAGFGPPPDMSPSIFDRVFGTPPPPYPAFMHRDIKAFFTNVPAGIDFIAQGPNWSDSVGLIYFDGGPLALYDMEDKPTIYGIPSQAIAYQHKINQNNKRRVSAEEYMYIAAHGNNRILNGLPGQPEPPDHSLVAELLKISALKDSGHLSEHEFSLAKRKLLM
ncbi:MAG TPA: hypothetical protein PLN21_16095 [Gemmatales bacterium]|nr:hypothetical protein [Gemmatales bacterium]